MEVNLTETQRVAVKKHCGRIWEKDCNGKQYARIYPYGSFVRTACADVLAKMDKRSERLVMALTSKDTFFNMVTGNWNFKTSDSAYCRSFADDAKAAMVKALDDLLNGKVETKAAPKPYKMKEEMSPDGAYYEELENEMLLEPVRNWRQIDKAIDDVFVDFGDEWREAHKTETDANLGCKVCASHAESHLLDGIKQLYGRDYKDVTVTGWRMYADVEPTALKKTIKARITEFVESKGTTIDALISERLFPAAAKYEKEAMEAMERLAWEMD